MKISNWCRKLAAALVAGGVIAPAVAIAGEINRNLVVNGGFENVNLGITGDYNGPKILDWTGPNMFAYSHDLSGVSVPDFANGDLAFGGHWYFSANNTGTATPNDVRTPGVYYQDVDVSSGDTATVISAGSGHYRVAAYMSGYASQGDFGNVHLEFRNGAGGSLGTALLSDSDAGPNNNWSFNSASGAIPSGTATVRVSLFGTPAVAGADGFIDLVSLSVSGVPGDYNLNGAVESADYTVWRNTLGSTTVSKADGTGPSGLPDGVVNRLDYNLWKSQYGQPAGSGVSLAASELTAADSAVPEPASIVLLCIGGAAVFALSRGRIGDK